MWQGRLRKGCGSHLGLITGGNVVSRFNEMKGTRSVVGDGCMVFI